MTHAVQAHYPITTLVDGISDASVYAHATLTIGLDIVGLGVIYMRDQTSINSKALTDAELNLGFSKKEVIPSLPLKKRRELPPLP